MFASSMKTIRTISSLLLAILVLVSSTSFTVGMHLCMGELQDITMSAKAEACEMERKLPPCHRDQPAPCCEDETMIHEAEELKISGSQFHTAAPIPFEVEQSLTVISEIIPSESSTHTQYPDYSPPLRSYDLTIAHRVFLI
jgi:hypothetical protein